MRDKGKGRDRKRRRGPIGRKEERVGKNAHKSAHNVSSLHCYLNGFMEISLIGRLSFLLRKGLFPAATAVGRASSLPITPEKAGSH